MVEAVLWLPGEKPTENNTRNGPKDQVEFLPFIEIEKCMPQIPKYDEVREWYQPSMQHIQETLREYDYDIVMFGAVEGY
jgi:hypothetical protein